MCPLWRSVWSCLEKPDINSIKYTWTFRALTIRRLSGLIKKFGLGIDLIVWFGYLLNKIVNIVKTLA